MLNQLKYDEETVDKEIKRLRSKKKALSNNQRNLKNYLKDTLEYAGKERIKTPLYSVWVQNNNPRMIIDDESKIPKEFYEEQEPKLNTRELRNYLKNNEVEGVRFEQGRGVRFR